MTAKKGGFYIIFFGLFKQGKNKTEAYIHFRHWTFLNQRSILVVDTNKGNAQRKETKMSKRLTTQLVRNRITQLNNRIDVMILSGREQSPQFRKLTYEHKALFMQLKKINGYK